MNISLRWLSDYVDLTLPPAALAERLTLAGLEVSGLRNYGRPAPDGLRLKPDELGPVWSPETIVTAQVAGVEKHPQADKLKLVTLDYGAAAPKVVVTGAPNINVGDRGQKVIVALTGSVLYDGHASPKVLRELKPTVLRGVPSDAMVCSAYELGISDEHEGIIILPVDAPVGVPLVELWGDLVVTVDVLPNMARCLSMRGVAREVAALTGGAMKPIILDVPTGGEPIDGLVTVSIADPTLSRRYTATLIEGVRVGPSPDWLQLRLGHAGMRPISNVVDVTNFVMLEWGQPLHAFDFDALLKRSGGTLLAIEVRPARGGETLVTLDGVDRKLTPDQLVIADAAGPIAIAGVMGGRDTEVSAATTRVLLESAHFDAVSIRKTSRALDLPSEASLRFSKGVHPEQALPAARRAAQLLAAHAGGTVRPGIVDAYPAPLPPQTVELTSRAIRRLLGIDVPLADAAQTLTALGFGVAEHAGGLTVTTPPDRLDIQAGAADLIEELARLGGYDRMPATLLADPLPAQRGNGDLDREERVRDLLATAGLTEVVCYALTTPEREAALHLLAGEYVTLLNPITSERGSLRHSLLGGLLDVAAANLKHIDGVRLFEIGPVFWPRAGEALPDERRTLGIVITGPRSEAFWAEGTAGGMLDFFDVKGLLEGLAADLHLPAVTVTAARPGHLHPGKAAALAVGGRTVGTFGELHPKTVAAFDLGRRVVLVAELDLDAVLAAVPERYQYTPIPRFPAALRDVAVVVGDAVPAETVLGEIQAAGGELLASAKLFDVYRGPNIPDGTKSLAFALSYQAADKTLADKEIDKAHAKVEQRLKHVLKATIRGRE